MNAYMACCCTEAPCGEADCERGGVFICGTYTISALVETSETSEERPCCGQGLGTADSSESEFADMYFVFTFKAILKTQPTGFPFEGYRSYLGDDYFKGSLFLVKNGNYNAVSSFDNLNGCPNDPPPTRYGNSSQSKSFSTAEQEPTILTDASISLGTQKLSCEFSQAFNMNRCLLSDYEAETCFQRLDFHIAGRRLGEYTEDNYEFLFQFGDVQIDESTSSVEELETDLYWNATFFRPVQETDQCEKTREFVFFNYHSIQDCNKNIGECDCPVQCNEPCEQGWTEPVPCSEFSIRVLPVTWSVTAKTDNCAMNGFGMSYGAVSTENLTYNTDCYGGGPCTDPGPLPGISVARRLDHEARVDHELVITKWQFIPENQLPEPGPDWDIGLECV